MALASTAVLAGAVPAFADGATPAPTNTPPTATASPSDAPAPGTATPTAKPAVKDEGTEPSRAPEPGQVSVVPEGAPDTGVTPAANQSGTDGVLIGTGAAALAIGGAAFIVVRRRRATGA